MKQDKYQKISTKAIATLPRKEGAATFGSFCTISLSFIKKNERNVTKGREDSSRSV